MSANDKLLDGEYKKISYTYDIINDNDKIQSTSIDSVCELQLDSENYVKLKDILTNAIQQKTGDEKKEIEKQFTKIKNETKAYCTVLLKLIGEGIIMGGANEENYLDAMKTKVKNLKEGINKNNSSTYFKNTFTAIDDSIDLLKNNKSLISANNEKYKKIYVSDITGFVSTRKYLSRKVISCRMESINIVDKTYTVITDVDGKSHTINNNNVCLVADEKNTLKSAQ
jgi:hypothetical protein